MHTARITTTPRPDVEHGGPTNSGGNDFVNIMSDTQQASTGAAAELDAYMKMMKMMKMTPAQRLRAAILNSLGVTEEQVAAISPEKRQALEANIDAPMKQSLERPTHSGVARFLR